MDAYNLLDLSRDLLGGFAIQANRIDDSQIEKIIHHNIKKLEEIEKRSLSNDNLNIPKYSIDDVLYRISLSAKKNDTDIDKWSTHDLRILSYYIMRLQDDDVVYNYALTLLDLKWKNMFFNGLIFYVMNSWNMIKPQLRKSTCQLIIKKLQQYNDNNRKYLLYKDHANLFEEAGPIRMAFLLYNKKQDIKEAPLILGNKKASINQSYYSDVIVKYIDKKEVSIEFLTELFEKHNLNRTKKLVFASLVEQADKTGDAYKQTQLSNFINRTLGDVTLPATWAPFPGATDEEAQRLKQAMHLVKQWFTRRIIETFFEVCVQDRDRKKFWLDYVQYVSGFKIIGSSLTKHALQSDIRTSSMFARHFVETNSKYSQTAALVLAIRNKVIVEFSDTGALYVYDQDHSRIRFLRTGVKYMNSTNDLKQTDMSMLTDIDYSYFYHHQEGRMTHQGNWQYRLKSWFRIIVFKDSNTDYTPFFETPDESIFKAQELPKEQPIKKPDLSDSNDVHDFYKKTVVKPTEQISATYKPSARPTETAKSTFSVNPQLSLFNQVEQSESRPSYNAITYKQREAKYETNIKYLIASRWEFNNTCRFVCNSRGYYIYLIKGQRYYFIQSLIGNAGPMGSLWIKKPNKDGWIQIIHYVLAKELSVGYVKMQDGDMLYMEDLEDDEQLVIKL